MRWQNHHTNARAAPTASRCGTKPTDAHLKHPSHPANETSASDQIAAATDEKTGIAIADIVVGHRATREEAEAEIGEDGEMSVRGIREMGMVGEEEIEMVRGRGVVGGIIGRETEVCVLVRV
ncbi:MAG: hypothetical protein CL912_09505 [Deltaproteobacteria bacterium]|nr:hypothetical protein [Deltaproteobacteria bacterium]|tara:strand:+ start:384 stop:749 length:366 start_codon:yes stop_codon:yes gene_type:complete